jgi:hypothetical protein
MEEIKPIYVQLSPGEKLLLKELSLGLNFYFKDIIFEDNVIIGFINNLEVEKQRPRKTSRIKLPSDISESLSYMRSYLLENFSFNPTNQEIYWLICKYLLVKFPGFRDYPPN